MSPSGHPAWPGSSGVLARDTWMYRNASSNTNGQSRKSKVETNPLLRCHTRLYLVLVMLRDRTKRGAGELSRCECALSLNVRYPPTTCEVSVVTARRRKGGPFDACDLMRTDETSFGRARADRRDRGTVPSGDVDLLVIWDVTKIDVQRV